MSFAGLFKGKGASGFGYDSTAEDVTARLDLSGRTLLVTGSNSGIGFETARVLALRGARVIATARTLEKAQTACKQMSGVTQPLACELSEPRSILACVDALAAEDVKIDGIICNAGVMALQKPERAFGYELQFFCNHIGHFLLVTRLLARLTERGRVVMVSSGAHRGAPAAGIEFDNLSGERNYAPWTAYGQSKLANLLFAKELARRLRGTSQTANAIHPGVIHTALGRHLPAVQRAALAFASPLLLKTAAAGAATQCYVATHPALAQVSGEYFEDCNIAEPSAHAKNSELASRLWQESERIVAEVCATL
ncbi:MAG TPA: SDR family oxidoreductase [Polyangiaceae bacterium]|jgi:WW domain-containing oxidoreductase